jgi:hypothetical protein
MDYAETMSRYSLIDMVKVADAASAVIVPHVERDAFIIEVTMVIGGATMVRTLGTARGQPRFFRSVDAAYAAVDDMGITDCRITFISGWMPVRIRRQSLTNTGA